MDLTKNINDFSNFSDDILLMMNPSLVEPEIIPELYYDVKLSDNLHLDFFNNMEYDYLTSISKAEKFFEVGYNYYNYPRTTYYPSYLFLTNKGYLYINSKDDLDPELIMTDVSQIASGNEYHLILKQGRVYSLGKNENGGLGLGSGVEMVTEPTLIENVLESTETNSPEKFGVLENVIKIDVNNNSNVALVSDGGTYNGYKTGHVYTWGDNGIGSLGLGNSYDERSTKLDPVNIANEVYTEIGSQKSYSVFNGPSVKDIYIPTRVDIDNVIDVSMGDELYILVTGNKLYAAGEIMDSTWIDVPVRLKNFIKREDVEDFGTIIGLSKNAIIYGNYTDKISNDLYDGTAKIYDMSFGFGKDIPNKNIRQVISDSFYMVVLVEEDGMGKVYINSEEHYYEPVWNHETNTLLNSDITNVFKIIYYGSNENESIVLLHYP